MMTPGKKNLHRKENEIRGFYIVHLWISYKNINAEYWFD